MRNIWGKIIPELCNCLIIKIIFYMKKQGKVNYWNQSSYGNLIHTDADTDNINVSNFDETPLILPIPWAPPMAFPKRSSRALCLYSKESSHWNGSFEHPKQKFKLIDKEIMEPLHPVYLFLDLYFFLQKQVKAYKPWFLLLSLKWQYSFPL